MDLRSMKRQALQALCKSHGIPANSTNAQMIESLTAILDPPNRKGCLKGSGGGSSSNEAGGTSKKVTFSSHNNCVEFVNLVSDTDEDYIPPGKRRFNRRVGTELRRDAEKKAKWIMEDVEMETNVRALRSRVIVMEDKGGIHISDNTNNESPVAKTEVSHQQEQEPFVRSLRHRQIILDVKPAQPAVVLEDKGKKAGENRNTKRPLRSEKAAKEGTGGVQVIEEPSHQEHIIKSLRHRDIVVEETWKPQASTKKSGAVDVSAETAQKKSHAKKDPVLDEVDMKLTADGSYRVPIFKSLRHRDVIVGEKVMEPTEIKTRRSQRKMEGDRNSRPQKIKSVDGWDGLLDECNAKKAMEASNDDPTAKFERNGLQSVENTEKITRRTRRIYKLRKEAFSQKSNLKGIEHGNLHTTRPLRPRNVPPKEEDKLTVKNTRPKRTQTKNDVEKSFNKRQRDEKIAEETYFPLETAKETVYKRQRREELSGNVFVAGEFKSTFPTLPGLGPPNSMTFAPGIAKTAAEADKLSHKKVGRKGLPKKSQKRGRISTLGRATEKRPTAVGAVTEKNTFHDYFLRTKGKVEMLHNSSGLFSFKGIDPHPKKDGITESVNSEKSQHLEVVPSSSIQDPGAISLDNSCLLSDNAEQAAGSSRITEDSPCTNLPSSEIAILNKTMEAPAFIEDADREEPPCSETPTTDVMVATEADSHILVTSLSAHKEPIVAKQMSDSCAEHHRLESSAAPYLEPEGSLPNFYLSIIPEMLTSDDSKVMSDLNKDPFIPNEMSPYSGSVKISLEENIDSNTPYNGEEEVVKMDYSMASLGSENGNQNNTSSPVDNFQPEQSAHASAGCHKELENLSSALKNMHSKADVSRNDDDKLASYSEKIVMVSEEKSIYSEFNRSHESYNAEQVEPHNNTRDTFSHTSVEKAIANTGSTEKCKGSMGHKSIPKLAFDVTEGVANASEGCKEADDTTVQPFINIFEDTAEVLEMHCRDSECIPKVDIFCTPSVQASSSSVETSEVSADKKECKSNLSDMETQQDVVAIEDPSDACQFHDVLSNTNENILNLSDHENADAVAFSEVKSSSGRNLDDGFSEEKAHIQSPEQDFPSLSNSVGKNDRVHTPEVSFFSQHGKTQSHMQESHQCHGRQDSFAFCSNTCRSSIRNDALVGDFYAYEGLYNIVRNEEYSSPANKDACNSPPENKSLFITSARMVDCSSSRNPQSLVTCTGGNASDEISGSDSKAHISMSSTPPINSFSAESVIDSHACKSGQDSKEGNKSNVLNSGEFVSTTYLDPVLSFEEHHLQLIGNKSDGHRWSIADKSETADFVSSFHHEVDLTKKSLEISGEKLPTTKYKVLVEESRCFSDLQVNTKLSEETKEVVWQNKSCGLTYFEEPLEGGDQGISISGVDEAVPDQMQNSVAILTSLDSKYSEDAVQHSDPVAKDNKEVSLNNSICQEIETELCEMLFELSCPDTIQSPEIDIEGENEEFYASPKSNADGEIDLHIFIGCSAEKVHGSSGENLSEKQYFEMMFSNIQVANDEHQMSNDCIESLDICCPIPDEAAQINVISKKQPSDFTSGSTTNDPGNHCHAGKEDKQTCELSCLVHNYEVSCDKEESSLLNRHSEDDNATLLPEDIISKLSSLEAHEDERDTDRGKMVPSFDAHSREGLSMSYDHEEPIDTVSLDLLSTPQSSLKSASQVSSPCSIDIDMPCFLGFDTHFMDIQGNTTKNEVSCVKASFLDKHGDEDNATLLPEDIIFQLSSLEALEVVDEDKATILPEDIISQHSSSEALDLEDVDEDKATLLPEDRISQLSCLEAIEVADEDNATLLPEDMISLLSSLEALDVEMDTNRSKMVLCFDGHVREDLPMSYDDEESSDAVSLTIHMTPQSDIMCTWQVTSPCSINMDMPCLLGIDTQGVEFHEITSTNKEIIYDITEECKNANLSSDNAYNVEVVPFLSRESCVDTNETAGTKDLGNLLPDEVPVSTSTNKYASVLNERSSNDYYLKQLEDEIVSTYIATQHSSISTEDAHAEMQLENACDEQIAYYPRTDRNDNENFGFNADATIVPKVSQDSIEKTVSSSFGNELFAPAKHNSQTSSASRLNRILIQGTPVRSEKGFDHSLADETRDKENTPYIKLKPSTSRNIDKSSKPSLARKPLDALHWNDKKLG